MCSNCWFTSTFVVSYFLFVYAVLLKHITLAAGKLYISLILAVNTFVVFKVSYNALYRMGQNMNCF